MPTPEEQASEIIGQTLARSDRLRQFILKRVFEGRLIGQDPLNTF